MLIEYKKVIGQKQTDALTNLPLGPATLTYPHRRYLPIYMAQIDISFPLMHGGKMSWVYFLLQKKFDVVVKWLGRKD